MASDANPEEYCDPGRRIGDIPNRREWHEYIREAKAK